MNLFLDKIKSNTFPFIVAVTLLLGCSGAWYFFHPLSPYHKRYTFVIRYEMIGTLSPGNRVGVQGITKGQVLKVELTEEAVYVTVEVLADTKIAKNSEFRLITSGLMGEREVNVICGDAQDYIADGDTVKGVFDNGTSGISKDLMAACENLREIKDKMVALKDTFTTGSAGQRIDRISRKGTKIVKTANAMADESSAEVREALEKGRAALQKAKDLVEKLPDRSEESLKKAAEVVERVDSLVMRMDRVQQHLDSISSNLDQTDNTVGLIVSGKGRLIRELDAILNDTDALISDIKKQGLKLNIDIF